MYEIDERLLDDARHRIARERWQEVTIELVAPEGVDLIGAKLSLRLTRHAFRFGCNGFGLRSTEDRGRAYEERFAALLNYATLPFYWGSYEPEQGQTREALLREMATWCREHDIAIKGHPLAWHEVYPRWAWDLDDEEVLRLQQQRIVEIVAGFRGLVDTWDVVNEATVGHNFANAIGHWITRDGAATVVNHLMRLAHEANPEAELLYNDFNIRAPEYEALVQQLLDRGTPLHALGLQSHMHVRTWPLEEAWTLCERYARFGIPLHFTELTVLSGDAKDPSDTDWHTTRQDWPTTEAGEESQACYGEAIYTMLYSHPSVEAITWWDFSDNHAWQGAPAGLVRRDMHPKPLYERLMTLVWGAWATRYDGYLGDRPQCTVRCVAGQHRLQVTLASGQVFTSEFSLERGDDYILVSLASPA